MVDLQKIDAMPYAADMPFPRGAKFGLLPKDHKPGEVCPLFRERCPVIPKADWDSFQTERGMMPFVWHVYRQKYGSCAAESCTSGTLLMREFAGLERVLLNPLFLYYHTSGGRDAGSTLSGNLQVAREKGIAPESVWPYSNGFRRKPSDEAYEAAKAYRIDEFYEVTTVEEHVSAILQGFVVACGSKGHALLGVHHAGDYPVVLNTWGDDWGEGGFGKWDSYRRITGTYGSYAYKSMKVEA